MTMLQLENVSYTADGILLISDVNFTLENKGINAILGPNGAGKSLLLSLIHGLIKPAIGTILWDDNPAHKTKLDRGYVFQSPIVLRRSVRDNLIYPTKALRKNISIQPDDIENMLKLAHLSPRADQPAASLSGGEAQRMAIARALITQPTTLLLDEPCSNLDPASTKLIELMIHDFVAQGGSVFISTHDLAQAKRLAETVLFMESGELIEQRQAKSFFAAPATPQGQSYLEGDI